MKYPCHSLAGLGWEGCGLEGRRSCQKILGLKRLAIAGSHNKQPCLKALSTSVTHWDPCFHFRSPIISFSLISVSDSHIYHFRYLQHYLVKSSESPGNHCSAAEVVWFICHMELIRKRRRGGICFYSDEGWLTDVTVLEKIMRPSLRDYFRQLWKVLFTVGVFLLYSGWCLQPHLRPG